MLVSTKFNLLILTKISAAFDITIDYESSVLPLIPILSFGYSLLIQSVFGVLIRIG
jgi:hypothetical protein